MFLDKKIVVVTPAGRKEYLELLIPQILKLKPVVDEYRLWVNTKNQNDIEYMETVKDDEFIKLEYHSNENIINGNLSICKFFKNCCDPNTVYVRFDDDIIFVDNLENFKNFLKFRIENEKYFLVYGNILNNCVISHIHQRLGNFPEFNNMYAEYFCTGENGWKNPIFAEKLHKYILCHDNLDDFRFNKIWNLFGFDRVSINCISWLGSEFLKFNGEVGMDEEQWLSVDKPKEINKLNCIYGNFICIHYAFFTQREYLNSINLLDDYKQKLTQFQNDL